MVLLRRLMDDSRCKWRLHICTLQHNEVNGMWYYLNAVLDTYPDRINIPKWKPMQFSWLWIEWNCRSGIIFKLSDDVTNRRRYSTTSYKWYFDQWNYWISWVEKWQDVHRYRLPSLTFSNIINSVVDGPILESLALESYACTVMTSAMTKQIYVFHLTITCKG